VVSSAKVLGHGRAGGADAERNAILDDIRLIVEADRCGWKYMWAAEHHFLTSYSTCPRARSSSATSPR
jgi:alkanesulfonate monooxygenase SsuD/methylene tetrahydromethanopterin reductase-like flavin-dependent oxidoreductase (luciferase family)